MTFNSFRRYFSMAYIFLLTIFISASAFGQTADTLSYESTTQKEAQAMQELQPPALDAPSNESISQQEDNTNSLARTGNLADAITILQQYNNDDTGLSKTPLMLIHGIHGSYDWNQNGIIHPYYASIDINGKNYWANFISYFDGDAELKDKYKVYIFSYLSDYYTVKEIARSLKNHIDSAINSGGMKDGKIILLAHSMGGLVARSYMNEHSGGERIEKLITLATPHHGTPAANELAREHLSTDYWFSLAMDMADNCYWGLGSALSSHPDAPNRSDLRWDNYDDRMSGICWSSEYAAYVDCYNNSLEKNQWLQELNKTTFYDSNIIAYYGYIYLNDPIRMAWINDGPFFLATNAAFSDDHGKLRRANLLMSEGMNNYYLYNDGLVPSESAYFNLHTIADRRQCAGYDHLDMRDGNTTLCSTGKSLYASLKDDLFPLPNLTLYTPSTWSDKIVVATTSSATTDSSTIFTADNIYINFAVVNTGSSSISTPFYTDLYVDGVVGNTSPVPSLNAGIYAYYSNINIGTLSAGTHTIKIVTDSTNAVTENNETDNEYTKTITVVQSNCANTSTLSAVTGVLHDPALLLGEQYYWFDFQQATTPSGDFMFKVIDFGPVNNPADFSVCQTSVFSFNNYILHIPDMIFNGASYQFDLQYIPTTDGLIWLKQVSMIKN